MNTYTRLVGFFPCGVGLTLLMFLWSQPFDGFHSPPLFFRILGSFVGLFFIFIGVGFFIGPVGNSNRMKAAMKQHKEMLEELETEQGDLDSDDAPSSMNYQCSTCGAPLGTGDDVSPHGDVKCTHCGKWFNIHQSS